MQTGEESDRSPFVVTTTSAHMAEPKIQARTKRHLARRGELLHRRRVGDDVSALARLSLASVLGASASFIGVIEGAAESVAALLKLASGWWSDRVESRKTLVMTGYMIASVIRPFTAATHSAGQVLAIRVTDRVGKGIRSTPRDALDRRIGGSFDSGASVRVSRGG